VTASKDLIGRSLMNLAVAETSKYLQGNPHFNCCMQLSSFVHT